MNDRYPSPGPGESRLEPTGWYRRGGFRHDRLVWDALRGPEGGERE